MDIRNLSDEESAIYEKWLETESTNTGVNIMR